MSTHKHEPWMEAAANEIHRTVVYGVDKEVRQEWSKIIARHAPAVGELVEAAKAAERYMTERGVSHEYPVMINLRRELKKWGAE